MALIGNVTLLSKMPLRQLGGTTLSGERSNWNTSGANKNSRIGGLPTIASKPAGYVHPGAWVMPIKPGALSSFNQAGGTSSVDAALIMAKLSEADLTGSGTVTIADLAVLIKINAALSGVGTVTDADLAAVSSLAASLDGAGTISAQLSAIIPILADLFGTGTATGNLTGLGRLEAELLPFTELSPQNLASQLLDESDIETGVSMRESLRLIIAALAGKLSGAPGTTITIRNVGDTKDRIIATVDSNGNRSSVTYDVGD
jgi:hypothetical protein